MLRLARGYGCYKAILDCKTHNITFYEKLGFKRKEVQMALYFPSTETKDEKNLIEMMNNFEPQKCGEDLVVCLVFPNTRALTCITKKKALHSTYSSSSQEHNSRALGTLGTTFMLSGSFLERWISRTPLTTHKGGSHLAIVSQSTSRGVDQFES